MKFNLRAELELGQMGKIIIGKSSFFATSNPPAQNQAVTHHDLPSLPSTNHFRVLFPLKGSMTLMSRAQVFTFRLFGICERSIRS